MCNIYLALFLFISILPISESCRLSLFIIRTYFNEVKKSRQCYNDFFYRNCTQLEDYSNLAKSLVCKIEIINAVGSLAR